MFNKLITNRKAKSSSAKFTLADNFRPIISLAPFGKRRKRFLLRAAKDWSHWYVALARAHGRPVAQKCAKAAFNTAKHYVMGHPIPYDAPFPVRAGPCGLPRELNRVSSWLKAPGINLNRLALTVLNGYRLLECEPTADYSSIEKPLPDLFPEMGELISAELPHMLNFAKGVDRPSRPPFETLLFTKGPYGSKGSFEFATAAKCVTADARVRGAILDLIESYGNSREEADRYILQSAASPDLGTLSVSSAAANGKVLRKLPAVSVYIASELAKYRSYSKKELGVDYAALNDIEASEYDVKCLKELRMRFKTLRDQAIDLSLIYAKRRKKENKSWARAKGWISWLDPYFARLSFIPKEGGGSRPITPVNYFVQDALKPLHDYFMNVLRRQPGDCTYDESSAIEFMRRVTRQGAPFSGYDWSSATDMVSRWNFLRPSVEAALGSTVADAWEKLMHCKTVTSRPSQKAQAQVRDKKLEGLNLLFRIPMNQAVGDKPVDPIAYRKGAPMGLYGL